MKLKTPKEILSKYVKGALERDYDLASLKYYSVYISSALKAIRDAQNDSRVFYNNKYSETEALLERALEGNAEQASIAAGDAESEMQEKILNIITGRLNFIKQSVHYMPNIDVKYTRQELVNYLQDMVNEVNKL